MSEVWKDIDGYEGMYQVSSLGRVRSLDRVLVMSNGRERFYKGKILNPVVHTGGYLYVSLGRGNKRFIHRLVAQAFIPNPDNLPEVNHKDGNKENNDYRNLEWVTPSDNQRHSKETGLAPVGEIHPQAKLSNEDVRYIRENYIPKHPEFGGKALAAKFGVARSIISRIVNGTKRVHG